jgi:HSP20 family protein
MIVRHRYPTVLARTPIDRSIDRAFEQITNSFFETRRSAGPVVDGQWHDDQFVITVDLPGVPAEAVSVEVVGDVLSLQATTDTMQWQRTVRLGDRLDPEQVSAHHVDGRLTVRIGTYAEPEARRVEISTTPPPAAIEARADEADVDQSIETSSDE